MMTRRADEYVGLSTATWITLIALISGGVAANLGMNYNLSWQMQARIDRLDDRWQQRIIKVTETIKSDIDNVELKISPSVQVDRNTRDIADLHHKIDELTKKANER